MNKTGIGSLLIGLIVLAATWYTAFFRGGEVGLATSFISLIVNGFIVGGFAWLGLFLIVLGILILVI
jgi:hypothetical protein